jgi:hypothetical protein
MLVNLGDPARARNKSILLKKLVHTGSYSLVPRSHLASAFTTSLLA